MTVEGIRQLLVNLGTDARVIWEYSSESDGDQCIVFQTHIRGQYRTVDWYRRLAGESDLDTLVGLLKIIQVRLWEEVNTKSIT